MKKINEHSARVNEALDENLTQHFGAVTAHRPFNWAVEFPEIFLDEEGKHKDEAAGFDVVVGNPPWEIVKPDLREYYAQFDPDIESRLTRKKVEQRIEELDSLDPTIEAGWLSQKAKIEEKAKYYRKTKGFVRQGRGDRATHKLFVERGYGLLEKEGRLSFVIPSGIYTDLGTKPLREMLLNEGRIEFLYNFSNERFFFPYVDHRVKFTLLGARKGNQSDGFWATFRFNPRVAVKPDELPEFLSNPSNLVYIRLASLERFSPDSLSVMEFQSQQEVEIIKKIFEYRPLIGEELDGHWFLRLNREFDMTNDRALFNQSGDGYPLYEGKMIHQYDGYYRKPRFWINIKKAHSHFRKKKSDKAPIDYKIPRLGFREIARTTDSRTLIATILPPETCCNHKITVAAPRLSTYRHDEMLFTLSVLNSLVLDFIVRLKISVGVSMFHFYQLPLPRLTSDNYLFDEIVPRAAQLTCTAPDYADLWENTMGTPWDQTERVTNLPERQQHRDELDAIVAHLYGLSREDFDHILGTFPLVFPDSDEGRAKREALLNIYDGYTGKFG